MPPTPLASFQTYFADIEDPRVERTRRYELLDLIVIAICAVICGADDWVDVEAWGNAKLDWLRQYLPPLPSGTRSASHDTFGDVFGRLKPEQFETSFLRGVQAVTPHLRWVQVWGPAVERSWPLTARRCAARTTAVWARVRSMWLAPEPAPNTCCWARSRSMRNPTKLRLLRP